MEIITNHEITRTIVTFVEGLSSNEYRVIIVVSTIILLLIFYRWFGVGAVIAIGIILMLGYVLYSVNIKSIYDKQSEERSEHMKLIEEELEK